MIKQLRSWWKDSEIPNLIGKKKVDWSVFEYGSHIPIEFHSDFIEANDGEKLSAGQSKKVEILHDGHVYDALLINLNQKSADRESMQIRYDSNKELRALMGHTFKSTLDYIASQRSSIKEDGKKEQIKVPEMQWEYIEFYATGIPYRYEMKLLPTNTNSQQSSSIPTVWWVNQGDTLSKGQAEGTLWAPLKTSNGRSQYHWDTMDEVQEGDIILHYANGALRFVSTVIAAAVNASKPQTLENSSWEHEGRLVKVLYSPLDRIINLQQFSSSIMKMNIPKGPIHSGSGVKQGYLFNFSVQALQVIQSLSKETNWPEFTQLPEVDSIIDTQEKDALPMNDSEIQPAVAAIQTYIKQRGFTYPELLIENFYLSLKTKPFVILAGISGTGKTKLVKLFAEALGATDSNQQFTLIPVRPDWSDPSDLLGYKDLSGTFRAGKLTEVLLEASKPGNRNKPYFVCLDEMNLARVEHYFSDMLSILETQKWKEGRITTDAVISKDTLNTGDYGAFVEDLGIPSNVFLIGTVNMDETTHPFSKKVLDRANTLEFNYVQLEDYPSINSDIELVDQAALPYTFLSSDYLQLQDAFAEYAELVKRTTEKLVKINTILEENHSHIGFRVRDAVSFYMIYNQRFGLMEEQQAFDLQLLQKILPRVQGSSHSVKRVLVELMLFCVGHKSSVEDLLNDASELYKPWKSSKSSNPTATYPQSARKLAYMLRRLEEDGFTSFWLS
jgi:5-methylcytosine-specific restriction protein B